jgi:hypothetical protein
MPSARLKLGTSFSGGWTFVGDIEAHPNGRFDWFMDPDNNKVELWEALQVK